jgi:phosphoenolpyruvate carboxylase
MEAFAQALVDLGEKDLATQLPWLTPSPNQAPAQLNRKLGQAYSIAFQLLNIVEERTSSRMRRIRETQHGPQAEHGLWTQQFQRLKDAGFSEQDILTHLKKVHVEPVLTAHPTEAKRETARERHREIYDLMNRHENADYTPREQQRFQRMLQVQLEGLWRTGEIHVTRPTIDAELQSALHYLREVFPESLARAHTHLREAWDTLGYTPHAIDDLPPLITFGSWIGGDRDGHPFVTADVTAHALSELRKNALRIHRRSLEALAHQLPLSVLFQPTPPPLQQHIQQLADLLRGQPSIDVDYILERNKEEPWRAAAYLMRARILLAQDHPHSLAAYTSPDQLEADLIRLGDSLLSAGASLLHRELILPFQRQIRAFGFHSAALDIRQNSAFHERALIQLLTAAGIPNADSFSSWPLAEKRKLLETELLLPRPFLAPGMSAGAEADTVLACHRILAAHIRQHGTAGLGSLIVSMTRTAEDLFIVYLLAREAGLTEWTAQGLRCLLPVTPLFETMKDLQSAPEIVQDFISHPVTQRSFRTQPTVHIMVGYSDSNKDCGILASQWSLHQAQAALTATVTAHHAEPVFFHGRGGTVGRGAGPTHFFMEALPPGSLQGHLRMTEQGETIGQKYAHFASAVYNLELLMASATAATTLHSRAQHQPSPLTPILDRVSEWSKDAYRHLLHQPGFIQFYRKATPIDALEHARIGSRPSRRTGQATLDDLRAIPWVFSWTQARFYLPGWFGVGSALKKLRTHSPTDWDLIQQHSLTHPFLRYLLSNVESSLVSAHVGWMQHYASLVPDAALRDHIMGIILTEYHLTQALLEQLLHGSYTQRRPRLAYTLEIREQPLSALHQQQIQLLQQWRLALETSPDAAEELMPDLLVSINAVASGLRTTG